MTYITLPIQPNPSHQINEPNSIQACSDTPSITRETVLNTMQSNTEPDTKDQPVIAFFLKTPNSSNFDQARSTSGLDSRDGRNSSPSRYLIDPPDPAYSMSSRTLRRRRVDSSRCERYFASAWGSASGRV